MPADMGVVPMNQSSVEKNGWSLQMATRSRPVTALASLTAAVVASEPFLQNLAISAPRTSPRRRSAHSTSRGDGRVKLVPRRIAAAAASTTAGCPWPSATERRPIPYSMNSRPSTSQTWQPLPRTRNAGAPSGYWSSPFA
jgi:hypothetical protein